jgi:RNA-directed DNA polymerase
MAAWSPQAYKALGEDEGVPGQVLDAAIKIGNRIQSVDARLPVVLTLRHLSIITGAPFGFLRDLVGRQGAQYKRVLFRKKVPGRTRFREVHMPHHGLLEIQQWITRNILRHTRPHVASFAYHPQSRPTFAARQHLNSKWLLKIDIEDFFHNVSERKVFRVFEELGYPSLLCFELARLTTMTRGIAYDWRTIARPETTMEELLFGRHDDDTDDMIATDEPDSVNGLDTVVEIDGEDDVDVHDELITTQPNLHKRWNAIPKYACDAIGFLPQGAPSSPMLSNLVMRRVDARLANLATQYGFRYTRYSDDLAFSTDDEKKTLATVKRLRRAVLTSLNAAGFRYNRRKTQIRGPGARRIVLGMLVDRDELRLPKEAKSELEQHLYFLTSPSHGPSKHALARGTSLSTLFHHVHGKIKWAQTVEPNFGDECETRFASIVWPPLDSDRE